MADTPSPLEPKAAEGSPVVETAATTPIAPAEKSNGEAANVQLAVEAAGEPIAQTSTEAEPAAARIQAPPVIEPVKPVIVTKPPPWTIPTPLPVSTGTWAPMWFYSGLFALGTFFSGPDGAEQSFGLVLAGSDVDPYSSLGATRLFTVTRAGDVFSLGLSPDGSSPAPFGGSGQFPVTDQGISELYATLQASQAFAAAKFAYVAGGNARLTPSIGVFSAPLAGGYDPATGLRSMVLGSAVAQIVPLATFEATSNTQVYDPSPLIVPVMTSLVYDIGESNTAGATTFSLPVVYTLDQVSSGVFYVNKMAGPTVVNAGGPGYDASNPTAVVSGFTFTGSDPVAAFASQHIAGVYAAPGWQNTLGTPIWDFGPANSQFQPVAGTIAAPVNVFDPANSPLNGGSIPGVLASLHNAGHLYGRDRLASLLASAHEAGASADSGPGVAATTSALKFDLSSSPDASLVDVVRVPISATVTVPAAGGNGTAATQPLSTTFTVDAFIPNEAVASTGITELRHREHASNRAARNDRVARRLDADHRQPHRSDDDAVHARGLRARPDDARRHAHPGRRLRRLDARYHGDAARLRRLADRGDPPVGSARPVTHLRRSVHHVGFPEPGNALPESATPDLRAAARVAGGRDRDQLRGAADLRHPPMHL